MSKEMVDVAHRHIVMTIAEELRPFFYWHRDLLPILIESAAQVMKSIISEREKNLGITPGIIIVVHTFGRDLKFNPHIHALMTEGGLDKNDNWQTISFLPYAALRKRWQHLVLKFWQLEKLLKEKKINGIKGRAIKSKKISSLNGCSKNSM